MHASFVDAIFEQLSLRYGRDFLGRWAGLSLSAVKADWARELAPYADRPDAMEFAFSLLDPLKPPTAAYFRELCGRAPMPTRQALPQPKNPVRAAEVRRMCLRPLATRIGRDVSWAEDVVRRAAAGERVTVASLDMARAALRQRDALNGQSGEAQGSGEAAA